MNTVQPIRDIDIIQDIADYLIVRNYRDYMIFMFGIYTGLRISDILKLRVRDIKDKDNIFIREKKTNKEKRFPINEELKPILEDYIKDMKDFEHLFKSRKGINKPVSRECAYRILRDAAKAFGIDCIGTHTLRKTFGYHLYQQTHDIVAIQQILNHSSPAITLRYIGVNQDMKDKVMKKLSFNLKKQKSPLDLKKRK